MNTIEDMRARLHTLQQETEDAQAKLESTENAEERKEIMSAIHKKSEEFAAVQDQIKAEEAVADMRAKSEILQQPAMRVVGDGPNARHVEDRADSLESVTDDDFAEVSPETRENRTALWHRHWAGIDMSDSEKVAMRQIFPEERAFKLFIRHGNQIPQKAKDQLSVRVGENMTKRALNDAALTDTDDVIIPELVANELIEVMKYSGPMLEACRIVNTSTGGSLKYPKMDATSVAAKYYTDGADMNPVERAQSTVDLGSHTVIVDPMAVGRSALQDSMFSVDDLVMRWFGGAYGRFVNSEVTKGSTSNRVSGLITGNNIPAAQEITTAGSNAVVASDLLKLDGAVEIAYRSLPSFGLMMTDTTANAVRAEVVSNVGYVWQPDLREGIASTFNGHRVMINPDLGEAATDNAIAAVLGAFELLLIRIVRDMTIRRSEHVYIAQNSVGFFSDMRFDAKILDSSGFSKLKVKA